MRLLANNSEFHLLWWFQRGCCQHHTSWLQGRNKEVNYERIKSCIYNVSSFTHCKGISFLSIAVPEEAFANRLQDWVHETGLSIGETTHEFCTFHLQESLVNWSPIMEVSAILQTGHISQTLLCLASYKNQDVYVHVTSRISVSFHICQHSLHRCWDASRLSCWVW